MHFEQTKRRKSNKLLLRKGSIGLLIVALISLFLCIMPFSVSASTSDPTYDFVTGYDNGGGNPTMAVLNESDINIYDYHATSTGNVHGNKYTFYELSSNIDVNLLYMTDIDVDYTSPDALNLPNGGYLQFGYAPRNSYDFIGFGYEFDSSSPTGYRQREDGVTGWITLSTGEVLPIGGYHHLLAGDVYDYYYFRVELPAGFYRITNFHFTAMYQGIGSRVYTFRIGNSYVYKTVPALPSYDQQKYPNPDGQEIEDYHDAEQELLDDVNANSEEIESSLNITWEPGLLSALVGIDHIYNRLISGTPWIGMLVTVSVSIGIIGFLLNIAGNIFLKKGR